MRFYWCVTMWHMNACQGSKTRRYPPPSTKISFSVGRDVIIARKKTIMIALEKTYHRKANDESSNNFGFDGIGRDIIVFVEKTGYSCVGIFWFIHICAYAHGKVSCHTYAWVKSHRCMSHVIHIHALRHIDAWVMSYICLSYVTYVHKSCRICAWVMSHRWMSHVTHVHGWSYHTYERAMSHICMNLGTQTNESCHTYAWVMSHIYIRDVKHIHESCHTYYFIRVCARVRNMLMWTSWHTCTRDV